MNKYTQIIDIRNESSPVVMAVGFFDGVHLGHKKVIKNALELAGQHNAKTYVLTFRKHPLSIIAPEIAPPMLNSNHYKLKLLNDLGVSGCVEIDFTSETAKIPAEEFVDKLKSVTPPLVGIVSGNNWRFGHKGQGTPKLLEKCNLWDIRNIDHTIYKDEPISSTRIRKAVIEGNLEEAKDMLGRPFSIEEQVVTGKKLGRKIGFPTANFKIHNGALPPYGIYAVKAKYDGETYNGVINIGLRPTLEDNEPPNLELHILDFNKNIYGENIEIAFIQKIRDEQKFDNLEDLKIQIAKDIDVAKAVLADNH
ncbi:MAG: bifunctional riboflavin kinase/FAD synthetase [Kiritimatiellae bacterium]|jgi:riboflavin kinase/FMN adenylyltransferase|nr:bifunctional riboflavin kinase/FAD synthetase [Kiritimatiellia bacterium]